MTFKIHFQIWDVSTGENILTSNAGSIITFNEDRSLFVTDEFVNVGLWEVATRKQLFTFSLGKAPVYQNVRFSFDGTKLLTGTQTDSPIVQIWDVHSGANLLTLPYNVDVNDIRWNQDGTRILVALGGEPGYVQVWDTTSPAAFLPSAEATELSAMFADNVVGAVPQPGHYEGSNPQVSFEITEDGYLTNFQIEASVSGGDCTVRVAALPVEEGKFFIQAEGQTTGGIFISSETVVGTYEVLMCGDTVFFNTEPHPWMARLSISE